MVEFDSNVFRNSCLLELGDMIYYDASFNYGLLPPLNEEGIAQFVTVNGHDFTTALRLKNKCYEGSIPEKLNLKIYDTEWGKVIPVYYEAVEYTFQLAIDFEVNEVKTYCKLSSLMGDVIPRLYAYGILQDIQVSVGVPYARFTGPFLLLEEFKNDDSFKFTDNFYREKVLPLFGKIHELDIIHNNICRENMIVTKEGDFKLINFEFAKISQDLSEKLLEIKNLEEFWHNGRKTEGRLREFLVQRSTEKEKYVNV